MKPVTAFSCIRTRSCGFLSLSWFCTNFWKRAHSGSAISVSSNIIFLLLNIIYNLSSDTDSILVALSAEELDDVVKPHMRSAWPQVKKRWFADESPEQQKTPGLLKEEFRSTDGHYIGLSSKCYILTAGEKVKRSQKGTPRFLGMSLEQFKNCLFDNDIPIASYNAILQDPKQGSCVTKKVSKKSLNAVYYKHYVDENSVDISPFKTANNTHY